jgi:hypothetical protein
MISFISRIRSFAILKKKKPHSLQRGHSIVRENVWGTFCFHRFHSHLTIYKDKRVKLMLHSIIKFNNHLCHEYMYGKYENHQNYKRSYLDQYGPFYRDESEICGNKMSLIPSLLRWNDLFGGNEAFYSSKWQNSLFLI